MARTANSGSFKKGNTAWENSPVAQNHNPHSMKIQQFRKFFYDNVDTNDFQAVLTKLLDEAKKGTKWAVQDFLDRTLGKATQPIEGDVSGIQKIIVEYVNPNARPQEDQPTTENEQGQLFKE